jgi:hypothetical protein
MKAARLVEIKAIPLIYFSASKRRYIENVCAVTWEILRCAGLAIIDMV